MINIVYFFTPQFAVCLVLNQPFTLTLRFGTRWLSVSGDLSPNISSLLTIRNMITKPRENLNHVSFHNVSMWVCEFESSAVRCADYHVNLILFHHIYGPDVTSGTFTTMSAGHKSWCYLSHDHKTVLSKICSFAKDLTAPLHIPACQPQPTFMIYNSPM